MTPRDEIRLLRAERHAEGYLELGMAQHALDTLDQVGRLAGASPHALYLRGEALRTLERYAEALKPLLKAAQAKPKGIHVWLALGWCYKRTGQLNRAVEALQRALNADKADALVHYNLACYLSLAGDRQRALAHLSRAFAIDSHYRRLVHDEPDFDPIRADPEFQALTSIIV